MGSSTYPNLGFDPAPGDLEAVGQLVSALGRVSRDSGTAKTEVDKLGTSDGLWVGESGTAFSDSVAPVSPYLQKALGSMGAAHRALSSWETQLSGFQARARRLEDEAASAVQCVSAAQSAVDALPTDVSQFTDAEKDAHESKKQDKQRALDTANDELTSIRNRARTLHTEFTEAAGGAERTIRDAADDAPPEPGWFEEAVDAIADFAAAAWETVTDPDFWKLIGDFLADLALVIGIICLFAMPFGGIAGLALIGFLVGAGALGFHAAALAGGAEGVTWQTLAWDAAGVLTGGVGLAGSALAKSGMVLVQAGRTLRATQGFAAALSRVRPGNVLGGLRQLPSGVANSARGFRMSAKGWTHFATGKVVDGTATVAGAAFALGSNSNNGRWLDGDWNGSDIPLLGPLSATREYVAADEPAAAASGRPRLDAPATLTSAGASFTSALQPSQWGTAA
ncbi:hypothetical protein JJV70_03485 [Streptomyces sp. JJ66]|uniref:putative T7SS-secreted protein n=1 Tax=Streptomyces sp. JJ66 TaxID=2803843 RepID=UPI001C56C529|nr:hypothetical protein [Streptomyces sp. JJ66]MBW1601179.1 hypothetical protein [Streptomyces sp. JJ66]